MDRRTPPTFNDATADVYDGLNKSLENLEGIPNKQEALDAAEYLLAGVLEAGPDNGVEPDFIEDINNALNLLQEFHHSLTGDNPYYFPTS